MNVARFRVCCERLGDVVEAPFFVKIGAHDGITGDPCTDILMRDRKWRGLLVEPVPAVFRRLETNFDDIQKYILENVAIGGSTGTAAFYHVDPAALDAIPSLPAWFDMLGSFSREHILKHLSGSLAPYIRTTEVQVMRVSDLLEKHRIVDVHLLHIDTEGSDYDVLSTLDFSSVAPIAVFVEHVHLTRATRSALRSLLRGHGYTIWNCGTDYFALNRRAYRSVRRARRSS